MKKSVIGASLLWTLAACGSQQAGNDTNGSDSGAPNMGGGGDGGSGGAGNESGASGSGSGVSSGSSSGSGAGSGSGSSSGSASGSGSNSASGSGSGSSSGGGNTDAGGPDSGSAGSDAGDGAGAPTCKVPSGPPTASPVTFNDNGGWSWYQDERAIVDTTNNRLILGSVASGGSRDGNVEATVYDLASGSKTTTVLNNLSIDDHNAPGFVITDTGTIAAMWATHRLNCNSYFTTFNGTSWGTTQIYDWSVKDGCPWGMPAATTTNKVTYANPYNMSTEKRIYSGVRSVGTSPNFLSSTDNGASWSYYGRLTASPQTGYVAGYYKYWGNGVDRIDWVGTEAHPRDADNSLWHGYVKGGNVYNSFDTVVDSNVASMNAPDVSAFTVVFKTGTTIHGVTLNHMWNHDIMRYADGSIAILGQGRVAGTGTTDPDKRMIYSRFDGTSWKTTYLVKAGPKLYSSEEDYTGLSALDPDDPTVIYVSTVYDPRDDTTLLPKHEIFQGTTCDNGATFTWTPITQNSTVDNLRPIVPKWDAKHRALLWLKGTYTSAQSYTFNVVGLLTQN